MLLLLLLLMIVVVQVHEDLNNCLQSMDFLRQLVAPSPADTGADSELVLNLHGKTTFAANEVITNGSNNNIAVIIIVIGINTNNSHNHTPLCSSC